MKRIGWALGLWLLSQPLAFATDVCGPISASTTWTFIPGDSYIVTCTVTVSNNATLTIQPGVQVKFNANTSLVLGSDTAGILSAIGTISQPITFTTNDPVPAPGQWGSIAFVNTTAASIIDRSTIEYGGAGSGNTNIRISSSIPTIQRSTIRQSDGYGIYVSGSGVKPILASNTFDANGSYPLHVELLNFPTTLAGNTYTNNGIQAIELVGGDLNVDTSLPNDSVSYVVTSSITVNTTSNPSVTLTIQAGTTLKFEADKGLVLGPGGASYPGILNAQGTATSLITFTTNNAAPAPGQWNGIRFVGTTAASILNYCVVEYGGAGVADANISVNSSSPTIRNSTIRFSDARGITATTSAPIIKTNTVSDNGTYGIYVGSGTGSLKPTVQDNVVNTNGSYPLHVELVNFPTPFSGNTYAGNAIQAVELVGGSLDANLTLPVEGMPYVVTSNISVNTATTPSVTLTLLAGTTLKFEPGTGLRLGPNGSTFPGILKAQGTTIQPIVLTSNDPTPQAGDWNGINFINTTNASILDYVTVEYGGADVYNTNIRIVSASPVIQNSTIRQSDGYGIFVSGSGVKPGLIANTFDANGSYPLHVELLNFPSSLSGNTYTNNVNQAIELVGGNLGTNLTLPHDGIPYAVASSIKVNDGGTARITLTINPGATLKFAAGTGLTVSFNSSSLGTLIAQGTAEVPITFTTASSTPAPGQWNGISIAYPTTVASALDYCIIEYGGADPTTNANLWINTSNAIIQNSTIRSSSGYGLYVAGIGTVPEILNNTFDANGGYPLHLELLNFPSSFSGNTYTNNGTQAIELEGGNLISDFTLPEPGIPYDVLSSIDVNVSAGPPQPVTLTLQPNTTLRFAADAGLQLGGNAVRTGVLIAQGTQTQPITLTGISQIAGSWNGLHFAYTTATSICDYCVIEYGGAGTNDANVYLASSTPTIQHSTIRSSDGYGIYVTGSGAIPNLSANIFDANGSYPLHVQIADFPTTLSGNAYTNNGIQAIELAGGDLGRDLTLPNESLPYHVTSSVTVNALQTIGTITLTIEAGTVLKFAANTGLTFGYLLTAFYGVLIAQGTADQPIVLTANSASPTPGFWNGLNFAHTLSATLLDHVTIEYGGADTNNANIHVASSTPTIRNSTIQQSSGRGITTVGYCTVFLDGNRIANNTTYGAYLGSNSASQKPTLTGNIFDANGGFPLHLESVNFPSQLADNTYSDNGVQAIELAGGNVNNQTITIPEDGIPYVVTSSIVANNGVTPTTTLTIQPGVTMKFAPNTGLVIGEDGPSFPGVLIAQGTSTQPITFTTNETDPAPGQWNGINLNGTTSSSVLDYCVIEYGGADTNNTNIRLASSSVPIQNSAIRSSDGYGIYVTGSGVMPTLTNNVFEANGGYPLRLEFLNFPIALSGNTYLNNGIQAIELIGGNTIVDRTLFYDTLPYAVTSSLGVNDTYTSEIPPTLTIEPGVILKFAAGTGIVVGNIDPYSDAGGLVAQGTATQPIIFTADSAAPLPGFWNGVDLDFPTEASELEHCVIEYGGADANDANLRIGTSTPTIIHSTIHSSDGYGVYVVSDASPLVGSNNITDNALEGLYSETPLLGRLNWWGDVSGPSGSGPGSGDGVNTNVIYEPWLGTPFTEPFEWLEAVESPDPFSQSGGWTTFFGTLPEVGDWTITIDDETSTTVKTLAGTGSSMAQDWFGDDDSDSALSDGIYTYMMGATSQGTAQAAASAIGLITLTSFLPTANITSPTPNQMLVGDTIIDVVGTASGTDFESYTVEYGESAFPTAWTLMITETTPVTDGILASWDTTGLTGSVYTLRLTVTSTSGESAEESVTVRLLRFDNLADAPDPFSPNGDAVDDTTTVSVTATFPVDWLLTITDTVGTTINTYSGTGQTISQVWDGTDAQGDLVPDGLYTYQFEGTHVVSGVTAMSESGEVTLRYITLSDISVNPSVADPYNAENAVIFYSIFHALGSPMDVTVQIYDDLSKQLIRTFTFLSQLPGEHTVSWDGKDEGGSIAPLEAYYFTIDVIDAVGLSESYNDAANPNPGPVPLTGLAVYATYFDPYQNDLVSITYDLDYPGRLTINVRDSRLGGNVIRSLLNEVVRPAGFHVEYWDGRKDDGELYEGEFGVELTSVTGLPENPIILQHLPLDFRSFRAEAYLIHPLYSEISALTYTLTQDATVTITIADPNGSTIRTLLIDEFQFAGAQTVEWDGRTDSGEIVSVEGDYAVTLTGVEEATGLTVTRNGTVVVYR